MPTRPTSFDKLQSLAWQQANDRARRQQEAHRALYKTAAWRRLARLVLDEQPICGGYQRACQQPATDVDHIEPLDERPELALVRENLQGLCKTCHARKTRDGR